MISQSCSWCHELNELRAEKTFCWRCGHRADAARMMCDCRQCSELAAQELIAFLASTRGA